MRTASLKRFPGAGAMAAFFFAYLYLPILILIALSFNANRSATIWTGFSLDWYGEAFDNPSVMQGLRNSLIVAVTATLIATTLATIAAVGMEKRFRGQTAANVVIGLPLVVPEIVTAVATLLFFAAVGIKLGLISVIIAHTVFCIPFAYLPIRARIEGMDPALREAAMDLYADEFRTFRRVTLPLLWPGILSGAMLAFIISLDDFVITFFTISGGVTLPTFVFGMIRTALTPMANAVGTLILVMTVGATFAALWLTRYRG